MVRDRLTEFQQLAGLSRNIANKCGGDYSNAKGGSRLVDGGLNETTSFISTRNDMESFLEMAEESRRYLGEMNDCLQKMREIHSKILTTPGVHPQFTKELNVNVERFLFLSRSVSNSVKRMKEENDKFSKEQKAKSDNKRHTDLRMRKNHEMTLRHALLKLVEQFHSEQTKYKERCRAKINSYMKISGIQIPEEEVDQAIENGKLFNTVGIMMAERDKKLLFEDVKSRHEDIVNLEKTIREMHEMFQDLAMLVESQGVMVDHIETNVNAAREHAESANRTVKEAEAAKKRNIKLKILLVVCIALAILILFFMGTAVFCVYFPFICH